MKLLAITSSVLLLASCASLVDGQTQNVTLRTPGAEHARCHLQNEDMKYVIHTDQTLEIMKSPHDLEVKCLAAGNREKTITVKRQFSDNVTGNIVTGFVPGAAYDYFSRGGFVYPEIITVSFMDQPVKRYDLPDYHAKDVQHNNVHNNVVYMGAREMITEKNRYDVAPPLQKKTGLYGEDTQQLDANSFDKMVDDMHSQYNPHVNYDPSEEDK